MNPVAFSTLGVPHRSLAEILALADAHGYQGIELRCAADEAVHPGLDTAARSAAARAFTRAGLTPLGLASYVRVAAPGEDEPVLAELRAHVQLAADVGARQVRVFPGGDGGPDQDARAVHRLTAVAELARRCGVRVLLETHDSHRAAADAARVVRQVGAPSVGVLWDVLHTQLAGDTPARAAELLLPHLGYVQVKDAAAPGDLTPLALGAGTLPLREVLAELAAAGYQGWLVWEYEALWHPGAAPLPGLLSAGRAWLDAAVR